MTRPALGIAALLTLCTAAAADQFVRPSGSMFLVNGQPFRFVGYNLRGACHYGYRDAIPPSTFNDLPINLDYCAQTHARVIRVFAPYRTLSPQQTGDRLEAVLDACAARGMYVIVALIDVYHGTGMCPAGDEGAYTFEGCCGLWLLGHEWYLSGYKANYKPQAQYLAQRFRGHPAVFAWQLGNEIRDIGHGATFKAFAHDMAAAIRTADPNHMLSIGLIGAWHADTDSVELYRPFDFVATHNYNGTGDDDTWIARAINKPYVVDAAGSKLDTFGPNRADDSAADMNKWFTQRSSRGYMNWALMATPYQNGDGDHMFGIDYVLPGHAADFDDYTNLYAAWGSQFATPSSLVGSPLMAEAEGWMGDPIEPGTLNVSGLGFLPFEFSVSSSAGWLSVTPAVGQANVAPLAVQLNYDPAGLPEGTHTANLTILAPDVGNSPLNVPVQLTLTLRRGDFDADGDIDQDDYGRFQACLSPASGTPHPGGQCSRADYDRDRDVDSDDVTRFLACRTAPGTPATSACLQ